MSFNIIIKYLFFTLLIFSLFSCAKRDLKVPKVAMNGEEEVANHSIIWMFYNEDKTIDVNENNRISSTNWFFNIDKHLTLSVIVPEVSRLLKKHNEKSPHNTKPMKNYFTYVNTLNNHLSFYQFDSIVFKSIKQSDLPNFSGDTLVVNINSSTVNLPLMNDKTIIQPVFNSTLTFQEYFEIKSLFNKKIKPTNLSKIEFIFNEN